jgi:hypothetical protein
MFLNLINSFTVDKRTVGSGRIKTMTNLEGTDLLSKTSSKFLINTLLYINAVSTDTCLTSSSEFGDKNSYRGKSVYS